MAVVLMLIVSGVLGGMAAQDSAKPEPIKIEIVTATGAKFSGVVDGAMAVRLLADHVLVDPRKLPQSDTLELRSVNGLKGKMALPFRSVASWKLVASGVEKAPANQGTKSGDDRRKGLIAEEEARLERMRLQRQAKKQEAAKKKAEAEAQQQAQLELEKTLAAERLLARFPPEMGWGPEKRAEIERRKIVQGLFPSPEEKDFLDSFDAWQSALALREKREAKLKQDLERSAKDEAPKAEAKDAKKKDSRSRVDSDSSAQS